jgi:hypothetical protein
VTLFYIKDSDSFAVGCYLLSYMSQQQWETQIKNTHRSFSIPLWGFAFLMKRSYLKVDLWQRERSWTREFDYWVFLLNALYSQVIFSMYVFHEIRAWRINTSSKEIIWCGYWVNAVFFLKKKLYIYIYIKKKKLHCSTLKLRRLCWEIE